MDTLLSPLTVEDHEATAILLHQSLVQWYEAKLGQGARFGDRAEPFLLIPRVYEALDPGDAVAARDAATGALLGVCFLHPRETHVSVGIVATAPEAAGRGVARKMMQRGIEMAEARGVPLRLVSSLLNLDSFSLYTKLGFVPHAMYQDVIFHVPETGLPGTPPPGAERVRPATAADAVRMADLEQRLQGIRRQGDYEFFLKNEVGSWKCFVLEDEGGAEAGLQGFMVASADPASPMVGPGVTQDEASAAALLWTALNAQSGKTMVVLVPCLAATLVQTIYRWGGRNIELHAAQVRGPLPQASGLMFPTFLPETA